MPCKIMSVTCHLQGKQQNGIIRVQNKNKTNRLLGSRQHISSNSYS
nr:MAG TPA: hypothetical protein [Caudoviricetes sp.]